jgi:hypothetical protein
MSTEPITTAFVPLDAAAQRELEEQRKAVLAQQAAEAERQRLEQARLDSERQAIEAARTPAPVVAPPPMQSLFPDESESEPDGPAAELAAPWEESTTAPPANIPFVIGRDEPRPTDADRAAVLDVAAALESIQMPALSDAAKPYAERVRALLDNSLSVVLRIVAEMESTR